MYDHYIRHGKYTSAKISGFSFIYILQIILYLYIYILYVCIIVYGCYSHRAARVKEWSSNGEPDKSTNGRFNSRVGAEKSHRIERKAKMYCVSSRWPLNVEIYERKEQTVRVHAGWEGDRLKIESPAIFPRRNDYNEKCVRKVLTCGLRSFDHWTSICIFEAKYKMLKKPKAISQFSVD